LTVISLAIIAVLVNNGIISINVGIVVGVLLVIIYPLLLALLPIFLMFGIAPKVSLQISDLKFVKKNSHGIEGYQLKALVTNKGKKICSNLAASFEIKDTHGSSPNLLQVRFDNNNGQEKVEQKEEPMRNVRYTWIRNGDREYLGNYGELRQGDYVSLLFPFETISASAGLHDVWSEMLLKLAPNSRYKVVIEVKGEDSEKNTAIGNKKQTLTA
jgi:hypothetical protein